MLYLFYYTYMALVPAMFGKPLNCLTFVLQLNASDTNQSIDKVGRGSSDFCSPHLFTYEMNVYLKMNFVGT